MIVATSYFIFLFLNIFFLFRIFSFFFFFKIYVISINLFLAYCTACGILVPQLGIKPTPPALEAGSLNHWTTSEVPDIPFIPRCGPCPFLLDLGSLVIKRTQKSDMAWLLRLGQKRWCGFPLFAVLPRYQALGYHVRCASPWRRTSVLRKPCVGISW